MSFVHPLELPVFRVESSFLQGAEFERESGPDLPEAHLLPVLAEPVQMMAEEDVVSLVVERHHATTCRVGGVEGGGGEKISGGEGCNGESDRGVGYGGERVAGVGARVGRGGS